MSCSEHHLGKNRAQYTASQHRFWVGWEILTSNVYGLPRWLSSKEFTCNAGDTGRCGCNPWVGKIHWRRKWQPTPVFLPRKSHGERIPVGYSPWSHKDLDMTEHSIHYIVSTLIELKLVGGNWGCRNVNARKTRKVEPGRKSRVVWNTTRGKASVKNSYFRWESRTVHQAKRVKQTFQAEGQLMQMPWAKKGFGEPEKQNETR